MEREKSSPSALPAPDPEIEGLPDSSPSSVSAGLAPVAPSAWQSHPCCQTNPCATLLDLRSLSLSSSACTQSNTTAAWCWCPQSPCFPLLLSPGEQVQQHRPRSPRGTRGSQHHATLRRKRPHTVRITFFFPHCHKLQPHTGAGHGLASPSLGPWACTARVSWLRPQRAGPSPAAKG